jgi:hypothetical protein
VPLGRNHARPRCTVRAWLGDGAAWRADGGTAPAHERRRGTVAHWRRDGGARGVTATGERRGGRGSTAVVRAARLRTVVVGMRAVGARLDRDSGATGKACSGGREAVGRAASGVRRGREAASTWALSGALSQQRRALPCGPGTAGARRLIGGARSSVISKLKFTLDENSSKQIAKN